MSVALGAVRMSRTASEVYGEYDTCIYEAVILGVEGHSYDKRRCKPRPASLFLS